MVAERDDDGYTGKVLWHVTMSLDGFIAGPDDAMDWAFQAGKPGPMGGEIIEATGAILAGRRGYDLGTGSVHLAPVLLGEGVRFYEAPGVGQIRLERAGLSNPGQSPTSASAW
jgi:hypothetical protein